MDNRKKHLTWLAYVPVGFALLYFALMENLFFKFLQLDYLLFLLLGIGVAIFPVRTKDSIFTMISGVSLATFVIFGLVPELILTSIAILHTLFFADIRWDQNYRYALNLIMVAILSTVSALVYFGVEDFLFALNLNNYEIIPLGAYLFVQVITNQFVRFFIFKFYYEQKNVKFFNDFLVFSLRTSLVILPLSLTLIYLYFENGTLGILLSSIPFIMITIGLKIFYKNKNNNILLKDLNRYSRKLASKTNIDSVIDSFGKYLLKIFPAQRILYFDIVDEKHVVLKRVYHLNKPMTSLNREITLERDSISTQVMETQSIVTFSKAEEWYKFFAREINFNAESVILMPVNILSHHKGVLVMTENKQSVYDSFQTSLIEVFYQYFLVVLENAHSFENLEISTKTDYLTSLPNLRGLSEKMKEITQANEYEYLSAIVLDLDHFKDVNDIHGHEAGNEVLKQISNILREFVNEDLFVARYGGEEFVVFLTNYGRKGAYEVAEEIRQKIEKTIYISNYSILAEKDVEITVTASLGIATYPCDCDDIYELISLADRALYLKSKKDGRNRIAEFVRES